VNKDRLTRKHRSWNMSRIRGKNTTPEMRVRSALHRLGYRFRLHVRIPLKRRVGTLSPVREEGRVRRRSEASRQTLRAVSVDILLPKHRTAIFVHGCFWHRHRGCRNCTTPTHRRQWWLAKLNGNTVRDRLHQRALRKLGWRPFVVWECQTEEPRRLERLGQRLEKLLD
jgi:DNA mismatch endonuclease (patch repair protein)